MRAEVLTLFTGAAAGWDLGLERTGLYRTVAACEIDPWRRAVYARNFPGVRLYDDVRGLTADRLRGDLGRLPSVVVGSPPCQDASSANHKGRGVDGERTGLFFEAIRIVAECRPVWGCFENVAGIRTRGIDRVLAELEALGYACWPLVVGAVHAGANHYRRRMWLVFADADETRLALGQVEPGYPCQEQPPTQRSVPADDRHPHGDGRQWLCGWRVGGDVSDTQGLVGGTRPSAWADGVPDLAVLDDGPALDVAHYRAVVAAQGDAVVPQITEAIGRVMARLAA